MYSKNNQCWTKKDKFHIQVMDNVNLINYKLKKILIKVKKVTMKFH